MAHPDFEELLAEFNTERVRYLETFPPRTQTTFGGGGETVFRQKKGSSLGRNRHQSTLAIGCKSQTRAHIINHEVRKVANDLKLRHTRCKVLQYV